MEARAPNYVWRWIMRRVWQSTSNGDMYLVWRKMWCRVPETDGSSSALSSGWNIQPITSADYKAFFEAITEDSKSKLNEMLCETHGPQVTAKLAKGYNEDGETPLLMAIRLGKLRMVKYLLKKLDVPVSQNGRFVWKGVEYPQVPPLFAAIVCGQTHIIQYLIAAQMESDQTFTLINSVILSINNRQQKIDIFELLGAAYLCFYPLNGTRLAGVMCWKEAMNLRNLTTFGWQVIPKPEVSFSSDIAHKAIGYVFEFTSLEQLEHLEESDLQLLTQSVLVCQRTLNNISPEANFFNLAHLCQYVEVCHKEGEHSRVICTAILFLEYFKQYRLENFKTSKITSCILDSTTKSFRKMRDWPLDNQQEFTFANLMMALEFTSGYATHLQNDERDSRVDTLHSLACNILEMVLLIVEMFPQLNANEIQQFKRCLYRFIHMDHRWGIHAQNLLHMICSREDPPERHFDWKDESEDDDDSSSCNSDDEADDGSVSGCSSCGYRAGQYNNNDDDFEEIDGDNEDDEVGGVMETLSTELQITVIRLFLELGADPNSTDAEERTPLHFLSMYSEDFDPVQVIMEHGGHVDQADRRRLTPLVHFEQWQEYLMDAGIDEPRLQALINNILPLTCLAAQVLRKHQVPFDNEIPAALHSFVSRH